jgi:hypothetical protein
MWSVDRLHPNERGHRFIAGQFHGLLAARGFPVGAAPSAEPTSPAPTRRAQLGWLATKGTRWVIDRSTDLIPGLLLLAAREALGRPALPAPRALPASPPADPARPAVAGTVDTPAQPITGGTDTPGRPATGTAAAHPVAGN